MTLSRDRLDVGCTVGRSDQGRLSGHDFGRGPHAPLGIPESVSQSTQARPCAVKCTNTPFLLQEAVAVMFPGKWRTVGPGLPCGFLIAIEMDDASKMLSRLHKRSVGTGQGCPTEEHAAQEMAQWGARNALNRRFQCELMEHVKGSNFQQNKNFR